MTGQKVVIIKLVGLVVGTPTPFDGQYLTEYDPEKDGVSPDGLPMQAVIKTSPDPRRALQYTDFPHALETWKRVCQRHPVRDDGRPNRPLTAFTVSFEPYTGGPDADGPSEETAHH